MIWPSGTPVHRAFVLVAGLFQDAGGRRVPLVDDRLQPHQFELRHRPARERRDGLAEDAAAPERLAEPVAQLAANPLDVFLQSHADGADGGAVDFDGEHRLTRRGQHAGNELDRVAFGIGVRH
jgi:hypothetical protein